MSFVAFYTPMKTPDDPVPSGDRTMARGLLAALQGAGLGDVRLISRLRSRESKGDAATQDAIFAAAEQERRRLASGPAPAAWLTYHMYYKSPDLLGPVLTRHWGIPYALVEASRAKKRLDGPFARFAQAAEAACDTADVIFYLTDLDRQALERWRPQKQALVRLQPFLDRETLDPLPNRTVPTRPLRLVTCAMFREHEKMNSYRSLAAALALLPADIWRLTVIGDGPTRPQVEALFAPFGPRVELLGALPHEELAAHFRAANLLVWPGVGEAFGMVYLEAQAEGCPVLAEDRPGVRDVVRDGGILTSADNPQTYADAIARLAADPGELVRLGGLARARVAADHLLPAANATLSGALRPLMKGAQR